MKFHRASVVPCTLILQYFKHCLLLLAAYYTVFSSWGKKKLYFWLWLAEHVTVFDCCITCSPFLLL